MRLYLDDNSASPLLAKLLRGAGHDVILPVEASLADADDAIHLMRAIKEDRVHLTKDHDDFWILHSLIAQARGQHPGILVLRQDNDPTRDLTPKGIVNAIGRLEAAGAPVSNEFIILNHWR